jgi:hypothetical protein
MARKHKASSLDTPARQLATTSPIALTASQRSQREIATPDSDSGSYQFPSHQLELPVVLAQDSIASYMRATQEQQHQAGGKALARVVWAAHILALKRQP